MSDQDQQLVEASRDEAATIAIWALLEERRQPWWRLSRRRWLQSVRKAKMTEAYRMRELLDG